MRYIANVKEGPSDSGSCSLVPVRLGRVLAKKASDTDHRGGTVWWILVTLDIHTGVGGYCGFFSAISAGVDGGAAEDQHHVGRSAVDIHFSVKYLLDTSCLLPSLTDQVCGALEATRFCKPCSWWGVVNLCHH